MSDVPPEWDAYLRLQQQLARRTHIGDTASGIEAALNRALDHFGCNALHAERTIRSAARGERYRARLRWKYLQPTASTSPSLVEDVVSAREHLALIRARLSRDNWLLVVAVARGLEYQFLATVLRVHAGTLRARVLRMRRDIVRRFGCTERGSGWRERRREVA